MARFKVDGDIFMAAMAFGLLATMLVPLHPVVMDMLLALSFSVALLILLVTLYIKKPLDFSIFPSLLLLTTLFRLALNVASTRLILTNGAEGSRAAGAIIETFGQFVVGGDYIVGFVIFAILVVVNFVVITKGATRVAEVSARFTLDAMPGKQMAIDAELGAGHIDEKTARNRRQEISREADFYGSMDGASKFIRNDAIAGIVIMLINIIGGILIGVLRANMSIGDAVRTYTLLTIGDGLMGQVPALVISAAAGLLVTRVPDSEDRRLDDQFSAQLLNNPRLLGMLAASLLGFAIIPGLRIPFLVVGGSIAYAAWRAQGAVDRAAAEAASGAPAEIAEAPSRPTQPEDLLPLEPLTIEVGLDLIYLVDKSKGGELLERISRVRNQFAQDLGVVLPPVHLRDNLRLAGGEYVVLLRGEEVGRATVHARKHLAIDPGTTTGKIHGVAGKDPVFGLPAWWVGAGMLLKAQARGYTVVDVATVLTTHFTELMNRHAHELYDISQLSEMLERIGERAPRLVEDLIPEPLTRQVVLRVFRNLVREGVSVRDVQTILEALADYGHRTRDPDVLTEFVRRRLSRHISRKFSDEEGRLFFIGFAPDAEQALSRGLQGADGGAMNLVLEPDQARAMIAGVRNIAATHAGAAQVVVLCPPLARGAFRRMLEKVLPSVPVISPAELLPTVRLECVGTVTLGRPRRATAS